MTNTEFLHVQASLDQLCEHGETCRICNVNRAYASVAREMLTEKDWESVEQRICVREFADRAETRRRSLPPLN